MNTRPNVVLICVDQWRGDCISATGHPDVHTPTLDQLTHTGAVFSRAYSATPTCVPARMSLMTGLTPETHGRVGYADGIAFNVEETMPRAFRDAGYHTQAIGKMHYWPERGRIGFDDVILHDGYLHASRVRSRPIAEYDDYVPWLREQAGEPATSDYLDHGVSCNSIVARPWDKPEHVHPTNWTVTEAERWLYRRDPTMPFFLYLSFHRPHAPLDPPQWAFDKYRHAELTPPVKGDWVDRLDEFRRDFDPEAHVADFRSDMVNEARAGYYGLMTHVDHQIARFLQILGEFQLAENTVVAFTSDHGDMMGDHGMWRKGYAYEGSSRVPFILRGPGIPSGARSDGLVELRDIMPTLLEAAGIPIPSVVEGRSALRLLEPGTAVWRESLHGEHYIFGQSMQWIVGTGHKYVWWSSDGYEQLFDLDRDPGEEKNLAGLASHGATLSVYREQLVEALEGREEGFVLDGELVPGRPASPTLACASAARVRGTGVTS
ncbi:MAG: arylsulfatase [Arachnia sp.]